MNHIHENDHSVFLHPRHVALIGYDRTRALPSLASCASRARFSFALARLQVGDQDLGTGTCAVLFTRVHSKSLCAPLGISDRPFTADLYRCYSSGSISYSCSFFFFLFNRVDASQSPRVKRRRSRFSELAADCVDGFSYGTSGEIATKGIKSIVAYASIDRRRKNGRF